ncbi:hypothetical protein BJV77DRAFT_652788 [Russula vinacea]|nr:hypothetical protein BJV77DRAFT_652788 [Russula vinacea]
MVGPRPADETPNDKKQEKGEPNQTDALIQVLPSEVVLDDDDPIQSFSSSPSELPSVAPRLRDPAPCDAGVHSNCLSQAGSPTKSLDVTSQVDGKAGGQSCSPVCPSDSAGHALQLATVMTRNPKSVITKTESVMTSQPTACDDTLQHMVAEDDSASAEIQSTSFPTTTNDEAQESSKDFTDLDYLDGTTVIAEQPFEPHETENTSVTPGPIVETIDLTGSTPSPKRLPISTCEGEKITSPPDIATSSPALSKGRTNEDTTDSSMLDLTDTKYRDFEVSLDSSFCLPSTRTSIIRRPPTPPPPRTKRKSVTFAAPLEKVVEEPVGTQAALTETVVPTIMDQWDELEYLELAPELARASRVDSFHCLGKHLTIEPQPTHLSQHPASLTAKPLSLLSSPLLCARMARTPLKHPRLRLLAVSRNTVHATHRRRPQLEPNLPRSGVILSL